MHLEELYKQIETEAKPIIKKKFDYDIPIAKIEDAGITTTGAASEGNQLPELVTEYRTYCGKHKLWDASAPLYSYKCDNGTYYRVFGNQEVDLNG